MGHDPRKRDSPAESGTVGRYASIITYYLPFDTNIAYIKLQKRKCPTFLYMRSVNKNILIHIYTCKFRRKKQLKMTYYIAL